MNTSRSFQSTSRIEALEARIAPAGIIAAAGGGLVTTFTDADNNDSYETLAGTFQPFPHFKGALAVAMGDFNGDTNDELIVAKATAKGTEVRIYSLTGGGRVGALLEAFVPFGTAKSRGVSVATGDLNGDLRDELIIGAGPGDVPNVKIYGDTDSDGLLGDNNTDTFLAFATTFRGGVKVAAGNTNNIGGDEVIAASWSAGGTVAVFNDANANLIISDDAAGVALETFTPFGAKFRKGLNVAAGPLENAGNNGADVIVGNAVGKPKVTIHADVNSDGKVGTDPIFDTLLPAGRGLASGARVAAGDTDESSFFVEVLVGPGAGAGAKVKIFDDTVDAGSLLSDNAPAEFDAFAKLGGGLNLAFGKVRTAFFGFSGFPQTIPDLGTSTTSIFVATGAGRLRDLDVAISIFHEFNADLEVTLTHVASGISVDLFTDVGNNDNGLIIRLNDEAGTDIGAVADDANDDALTGTFNPEGAALLSAFDGIDFSGEWRLTIVDDAGALTGTLFSWGLIVTL